MIPQEYLVWAHQFFKKRHPDVQVYHRTLDCINEDMWKIFLMTVEKAIVVSGHNGNESLNQEAYVSARNHCLTENATADLINLSNKANAEFRKWIEQANTQALSVPSTAVVEVQEGIPEPSTSQFIDDESLIKAYDNAFIHQNHILPSIVPSSQEIDDNCLMEAYDKVMHDTL
jgi:hypothetical protein